MLNEGGLSNLENQIDFPVCSFTAIVSVSNEERMVQVPHMSPIGQRKWESLPLRLTHRFRATMDSRNPTRTVLQANRTRSRKGEIVPHIFVCSGSKPSTGSVVLTTVCVKVRECLISRLCSGMIYAMKVGTTIGEQLIYKSHQLRAHNLLVTDESMTGGQDPIVVRRGVRLDCGFPRMYVRVEPKEP